ncbi:MAG: tRNA (adenosine(37)-N6)-threonylcarbamoyltransferase complex ATPase subunit type 1 TsaE [Thermoanaerobaculia bacterium]
MEFESTREEQTRSIGRLLAGELRENDVVALSGPLGAGKTAFVRGLAEGLGADPVEVASPTFALMHEYECGPGLPPLVHLDLYRLPDREEELREIGLPEVLSGKIAAIEWPNSSSDTILEVRYRVRLDSGPKELRRIRLERWKKR